jgi:UDP-N-acetylglucosamine transferase subunit ALG13
LLNINYCNLSYRVKNLKICLICSSGGHLIEMQKIRDAFNSEDVFLVTHRDKFLNWDGDPKKLYQIDNVLVGKANTNKIMKLFLFGYYFLLVGTAELLILLREKPELIVSTGSAIAIPMFLIGKMMGIRTIFIESVCRVKTLSLSGRIVYPVTNAFLVQWQELTKKYKKARYAGNVFSVKNSSLVDTEKEYGIFLMIGTAPFPRLVKKVDEIAGRINDKVIMQVGRTDYTPKNADFFSFIDDFSKIQDICHKSKVVVTHGGAGSIMTALEEGSTVISVPRIKKYNEAYDDHQLELVEALSKIGLIRLIYDDSDLEKEVLNFQVQKCSDISFDEKLKDFLRGYVQNMSKN